MITRRSFFNLGLGILAAPFIKEAKAKPASSLIINGATIGGLEQGTYYIYAAAAPQINEDVFLGRIKAATKRARLNY